VLGLLCPLNCCCAANEPTLWVVMNGGRWREDRRTAPGPGLEPVAAGPWLAVGPLGGGGGAGKGTINR